MKASFNAQKFVSKRPCHILEYRGDDALYASLDDNRALGFDYRFSPPEMTVYHKEHLVFDVYGLIGNVGGTLGMCLGFSFIGIFSSVIEFIESKIRAFF